MQKLLSAIYDLMTDESVILSIFCVAFALKLHFFTTIVPQGMRVKRAHAAWYILASILFCGLIHDFTWIAFTLHSMVSFMSESFVIVLVRFAWIINCINYASLALLITSVKEQSNFKLKLRHVPFLAPYAAWFFAFLFFLVTEHIHQPTEYERLLRKISMIMNQVPLILTILITLFQMRRRNLPKIISQQIYTFLFFYIVPVIFFDSAQAALVAGFSLPNNHWCIKLSSVGGALFLTISIYYTFNKMLRLRFLNFQQQVNSSDGGGFFENLKGTLEQLGRMASFEEIVIRTQHFFAESFAIAPGKTSMHLRTLNGPAVDQTITEAAVETFLTNCQHQEPLKNLMKQSKILVYDEISCSNFYHEEPALKAAISFMDEINADVFLPIQDKKSTVAYLIIERGARGTELWTNVERDQMLMYANYLGNILYLLQNKNYDALVHRERVLKEELFQKHQEINQYRESIRSFMRNAKDRKIGILFYKNKHYIFGNQAARQLLDLDLNKTDGHPLNQAIKRITQQAISYKNAQHAIAVDTNENKIALSAIPGTDGQEIIILLHNPEIGDMIREQIERLPEPSDWDYLLTLQTTTAGQLINQLLPGSGSAILQTKVALLKATMNSRPVLIDADAEDAQAIAELLSHLANRKQFHVLDLETVSQPLMPLIFGSSVVFGPDAGLLEKLNERGTLYIRSLHYMDADTQTAFADFFHNGTYRVFKTEQEASCDVRIITSSNQLAHGLKQGTFSTALAAELQKNTILLPSLVSLSRDEFLELVSSYSHQLLSEPTYRNILALSDKEKEQLLQNRPENLITLKKRIQSLLVQKSKKNEIDDQVSFDSAYLITDPELAHAARLGKQALKDQRLMTLLWNKFKNPAHIAMFLGVNRTSVYRRCKTYNLS